MTVVTTVTHSTNKNHLFLLLEQIASCAVYDRTTALNNGNSQTCHPDLP